MENRLTKKFKETFLKFSSKKKGVLLLQQDGESD